jgi:hypothetical protein
VVKIPSQNGSIFSKNLTILAWNLGVTLRVSAKDICRGHQSAR